VSLVAAAATAATTTTESTTTAATTAAAATAAAAVATTAAATATTTVAAAATTAATATWAIFAGLGFVDRQLTAIVLLAIESADGGLRLIVAAHLHESEAFATAGVAIGDYLRRLNRAMLAKKLFQIRAVGVVAQIPDIKLAAHRVS
jgi:hypothetical protein